MSLSHQKKKYLFDTFTTIAQSFISASKITDDTKKLFIYVLKLEKNKYYIGKTYDPLFRIETHFKYNASAWTNKFKPQNVLELIPNCDEYDEDKITRKYMDKYGIENVRGGSFVSISLDKKTKDYLEHLNKGTNDKCFECGKKGHFAKDCPNKKEYIWKCNYCDQEFYTKKDCLKHEKLYCKSNISCFRCGRKGHYSSNCYAVKHIKGYYI